MERFGKAEPRDEKLLKKLKAQFDAATKEEESK